MAEQAEARESADFDVVIIGAGVAGLAAAIRLKQLNSQLSIAVLEKGAEVGAHILSGAVIDPVGLDALLPDWRNDESRPVKTAVREDILAVLTRRRQHNLPLPLLPKLFSNRGNYIVSLGAVCRWLGKQAEALGADIFPGFAAQQGIYNSEGALIGIITGDMGRLANGEKGANYSPGMELRGKYILVAEGARGSLAEELIARFGLDKGRDARKYGLGLKEMWEIPPERHREGRAEHLFGWPLWRKATGGGFIYHMAENKVALGLVVHLDYRNPYLSPFEEFQLWKTHPALRALLKGGKRLVYGARAINEGGYQSVPRLSFKGGALIGCAAGFVNLPRIKGAHNALLSAVNAANHVAAALAKGRAHDEIAEIEAEWRQGAIGRDLYPVRNFKPLLERFGNLGATILGGADLWCGQIFGFSPFGTLHHKRSDAAALRPAARCKPIAYPKPDNIVSFDKNSSVFLANINARENAPCHLKVRDWGLQEKSELGVFAGPSARYCPAGVYEWVEEEAGRGALSTEKGREVSATALPQGAAAAQGRDRATADRGGGRRKMRYVINAQNCVHCKTCAIKDPNGNIDWTPPEGGEGPIYNNM